MPGYRLYEELLAVESVDGNPLNPEKVVPFAAIWETQGTLIRLTDRYKSK